MIRLLTLVLYISLLTPVFAKSKPPPLPAWLYKKLEKTELLISKKSYQQAEENLKEILAKVKTKAMDKPLHYEVYLLYTP